MNSNNKKKLWSLIQTTGDSIKGKLPPDYRHPKGRNPYAHICTLIKDKFKHSYSDIPDTYFDDVCEFINKIKNQV